MYLDYFQAEQVPFQKSEHFMNKQFVFLGQTPVNVSDLLRGYDGKPPPVTIYTYFTLQHYFVIFFCVLTLQTIVIFVVKSFWSFHFKSLNFLEKLLHSIENTHFPFPVHDWDHEQGSSKDHFYRMTRNRTETLIITMINLGFNLLLLFPMAILCNMLKNYA